MTSTDPRTAALSGGGRPAALRRELLAELYPPEVADRLAVEVELLLRRQPPASGLTHLWDERDAWLITYPDQFRRPGEAPLATLRSVMEELLEPWLNGLHVTPFFPWSSDDGFAVTSYLDVDERYGHWEDVEALAQGRRLVVDAVINHLSSQSGWFRDFLRGDSGYGGFFRTADPAADLTATVRPRTHPLLSRFDAADGPLWAWTTFSSDQVDLDYRTPEVLLRVLDVLLAYVGHGANVLRLDAVAFLWKEEGTPSIHLPQTHRLIQFLRSCVESVDPSVLVLTETNVPSDENMAYFGSDAVPEAHLVYQFPLPALTLHALLTEDASRLSSWAHDVAPPHRGTSFLNFLASHDGVGVRPAEGLLDSADMELLAEAIMRGGGEITGRVLPGGATAVYELNSTWYSVLAAGQPEEAALRRHLATHAIVLALRGIPALYVQSLVAGDNDRERFAQSGEPRALNRRRFEDLNAFRQALGAPAMRAGASWLALRRMLEWRAATPAFHPDSAQVVLDGPPELFAVEREAAGGQRARVYVNVSREPSTAVLSQSGWVDASGCPVGRQVGLAPWSSAWLRQQG
jgi:glucosylglycerate phosphorylase